MEEIFIKKSRKYENGSIFEFRYVGTPFEIYDKEKVEKLITSFLDKETLHCDMLSNVAYIRTILKASKEKLLEVEYIDGDHNESVKYNDGDLFSYYECNKNSIQSSNDIEVKYQVGSDLNISFPDVEDKKIIDYPNITDIKGKFDEIINRINSLSNVNSVSLNNDSKAIIEAYKLFYNENPDFSKEDINIKIQTMVSILAAFDICFGDYSFSMNKRMPESLTLLQMVNSLFPLGEVTFVESPVKFRKIAGQTIGIVGKTIREAINYNQDMNETLITISKTLHAGLYDFSSVYDVERIVEYPNINLTYDEANSSAQLVKRIEMKLDDNMENFN